MCALLLMGFSGDTGRGKTILLSDIAGTALSTTRLVSGLTAADAAESSCRFPSGPGSLPPPSSPLSFSLHLRAADRRLSGSPLGKWGDKKSPVSQCTERTGVENS